jgi:hypothetical protein
MDHYFLRYSAVFWGGIQEIIVAGLINVEIMVI